MFGDGTWNSYPQKELKLSFNSQNYADVCICLLCKQTTLPQVLIALVISKLGPQNRLIIWAHCGVITIIFQFSDPYIPIGTEKWNLGILGENYEQYAAKNI